MQTPIDIKRGRRMAEPARHLAATSSLDDLADDPGAVEALSTAEVGALMVRALTVVGTLQARVTRQAVMDAAVLRSRERILSTAEVGERLSRSTSWIEKNLDALPPRPALAGSPGWREGDINDWIHPGPVLRRRPCRAKLAEEATEKAAHALCVVAGRFATTMKMACSVSA
jgi:predicted DNA-binding transcriptional regulator AlpA